MNSIGDDARMKPRKVRTEIERKFLLRGEDWRGLGEAVRVRQGFLASDPQCTVRVRTVLGRGYLTIKGKSEGISRAEYEYEIPVDDAEIMLETLCSGLIIDKTRHRIPIGDLVWEVDEFHGSNEGLLLAELELDTEDQEFEAPEWIGEEVSGDLRYFNSYLARHPWRDWDRNS